MNYREKRGAYLNCEKRMFSGTGPFDFPVMDPVEVDVELCYWVQASGGQDLPFLS